MTRKNKKCKKSQEQKSKAKEARTADEFLARYNIRFSGEPSGDLESYLREFNPMSGGDGFRVLAPRDGHADEDPEDLEGKLVIDGRRILQACCPEMADLVAKGRARVDGSLVMAKVTANEEVTDRRGERYTIRGNEIIRKYGECPFCSAKTTLRLGRRN